MNPPDNLTQNDLQRGGWNQTVTQAELDRIAEQARQAVENPNFTTSNFTR